MLSRTDVQTRRYEVYTGTDRQDRIRGNYLLLVRIASGVLSIRCASLLYILYKKAFIREDLKKTDYQ